MSHPSDRVTAEDGSARRFHLAIVFSDLCDSTKLAAALEAEHYAEVLARLRQAYQEVIPKHGGTVVRLQGDGVLGIFGYPEAREDDGRRATEASLELHDIVRELRFDPPLPWRSGLNLHTGIHSGLVLLHEGDLVRGRFDLLGNAPNVAARLCEAAKQDEILVSEGTLGAEHHFFECGERRYLSLRGVPAPIAVRQILDRASIHTRFEARAQRGLVPFVGRARELEVLEESLREAVGGEPCSVAVVGPAGLGKTRLVEEFLRRAGQRGCQIHRGYCESYLSAEPLQPVLQMLRPLFGLEHRMSRAAQVQELEQRLDRIGPDLAPWRRVLLRALSLAAEGPDSGGPQAPEATAVALRALFARLAAKRPLVLFIDDWQWADAATREVVGAIRELQGHPILILIATRGFDAGDANMTETRILDLTPFSEEEASETVDVLLPGIDPFLAAEIRRYAGGNPLFIEELCHSAARDDPDNPLTRAPTSGAWLETLILSRVAALPAKQAELVRTAAVIGNVIPAWLLERITGCAEDHPMIAELAQQDLIFPGEVAGTLRFKHGITRDAIYAGVGLHRRRSMHLQIAESLRLEAGAAADQEMAETLAYHYSMGGEPAAAARFAEIAGDKAMAASALDRAQVQYRAALAALDRLPFSEENDGRWSAIAQRLGTAYVFDPARDQLEVLQRAVERATARNERPAIGRAEYWLGYINYALGEARAAIPHCERALAATGDSPVDPLSVEIRALLGQARAATGDYPRALELLGEAIAIKGGHRTGVRRAAGLAYSLACKASVLGDRGEFDAAYACFEEALDAIRDTQHEVEGSILCWRSAVHLWQGHWQEARRDAVAAQRVAERTKTLYIFGMSRALAAYANWVVTRSPEQLRLLMDATSWLETRDKGLFTSLNYGWLAEALVASARFDEARRHAARALQRARKLDRLGEPMAYRALALASAMGHGRRSAPHYLSRAATAADARGSAHEAAVNQLRSAEIELTWGDRERGLALLDQAAAAFEAMAMASHLQQAARLRNQFAAS